MLRSNVLGRSTHRTRDVLRYVACWSCRHASTSFNPYPFPTHPNPQPHQIFHLPRSATQQQIKERYYDLVRIYHPDSPVARRYPADVTQSRFQSISKAYDLMRSKSATTGEILTNHREQYANPARFRPRASRRPHFDETTGDERWKERVLLATTIVAIVAFAIQTTAAHRRAIVRVTNGRRATSSGPYSVADEALAEPTESERSR